MNKWKRIPVVLALAALPLAAGAAGTPAPAATTAEPSMADLEQQLEDARARLNEDARRVAQLSMQVNGGAMRNMELMRDRMAKMADRGFLGVDLGGDAEDGVYVDGVTPGGGADKAGLRQGDVILSINGTVFKPSADVSASEKLGEFMRGTKRGDSLKVSYSRDGKVATVTATAGGLSDLNSFYALPLVPPLPPVPPMPAAEPRPVVPPFNLFFGMRSHWDDMQLVTMTSGLGQYFGTDKGLLVLHASKHSPLQLQDGDVIQQIGGRDPGNPPHAMRILGSYGAGEVVKLDIMRKGKPMSINVTLPKDDGGDSSQTFNSRIPNPGVPGDADDGADGS